MKLIRVTCIYSFHQQSEIITSQKRLTVPNLYSLLRMQGLALKGMTHYKVKMVLYTQLKETISPSKCTIMSKVI